VAHRRVVTEGVVAEVVQEDPLQPRHQRPQSRLQTNPHRTHLSLVIPLSLVILSIANGVPAQLAGWDWKNPRISPLPLPFPVSAESAPHTSLGPTRVAAAPRQLVLAGNTKP